MDSDAELERWLRSLEASARGTYWETLGCRLVEVRDGRLRLAVRARRKHLNPMGIVHGGVSASMLDNAMGLLAMAVRQGSRLVTTNLDTHFVAPLYPGELTATAWIVHQSGRIVTAQGEVRDGEGRLGSLALGSFRVLSG